MESQGLVQDGAEVLEVFEGLESGCALDGRDLFTKLTVDVWTVGDLPPDIAE